MCTKMSLFFDNLLFFFKIDQEVSFTMSHSNIDKEEIEEEEMEEEQDNEGSSSSPIPVNEEDNFEPVFETQEEQREHANQWRDAIAANMWNDVERFNNNEQ